jgi:hypothetical protein
VDAAGDAIRRSRSIAHICTSETLAVELCFAPPPEGWMTRWPTWRAAVVTIA